LHGDKETFHLAFRKVRKSYGLVPKRIHPLEGTMCQHDFNGRRIFQHRNTDKWDLRLPNKKIAGFWFEKECREYVAQLRGLWAGGSARKMARSLRNSLPGTRFGSLMPWVRRGSENGSRPFDHQRAACAEK